MFTKLNEKLETKYIADLRANPLCSCKIRSFPVKDIPEDIDFMKSNILGIFTDDKYGHICLTYEICKEQPELQTATTDFQE